MVARPPARNPTKKNHIGRDVVFFISFFLLLHTSEVYTNKHNPPRMATNCDKDILEAFDHNPQEGFGLLLERFQQPLYWHIRRLVVSHLDTEDITQEVFVRIYEGLPKFRGQSSLTTWIYRIATNEALRWLRRNKRRGALLLDSGEVAPHQEPHINYGDIEAVVLQRAISRLPRKQQLVFNLCYYDELDYEEVAAIVGCKPSAAKANYHLAKKSIKEFLIANL